MGKYQIIYADPPWQFKTYSKKGSLQKSADCHYSCMSMEDIMALPVETLAAEDCVLFLWVTFPLLREGLETMRRWGFTYKTCGFNWVKRNKKADSWFMGLGYWTRSNAGIQMSEDVQYGLLLFGEQQAFAFAGAVVGALAEAGYQVGDGDSPLVVG